MRCAKACKLSTFYTLLFCLSVAAPSDAQTEKAEESLLSAEQGGPRRLVTIGDNLAVYAMPSVQAEKIDALSSGSLFSNLGCVDVEGQGWCGVRKKRGLSGFVQSAQVRPAKGPDGIVPIGVNDSKRRVRKQDFDAKSDIRCAQEQGQAMGQCRAAVARSGGGDATVVVTFPNGFARDLYFVHGDFTRASATMSGVGTDMNWKIENDSYSIRVDDQRFELPDAFVLGRVRHPAYDRTK